MIFVLLFVSAFLVFLLLQLYRRTAISRRAQCSTLPSLFSSIEGTRGFLCNSRFPPGAQFCWFLFREFFNFCFHMMNNFCARCIAEWAAEKFSLVLKQDGKVFPRFVAIKRRKKVPARDFSIRRISIIKRWSVACDASKLSDLKRSQIPDN